MSNTYNTTIYVGVTDNLERRVSEHRTPVGRSFTSRYNCHKLVYYEEFSNIIEAISREKQIKSWNRQKKDLLILSMNPAWKDLIPGDDMEIATSPLGSSQ